MAIKQAQAGTLSTIFEAQPGPWHAGSTVTFEGATYNLEGYTKTGAKLKLRAEGSAKIILRTIDFLITKQAVVNPPRFGEFPRLVLKYRDMKIAGHAPIRVLFTMDERTEDKK